ncbi:SDR family oxidoreductase [Natronomonas sp. EA1]|uniref:SDR family oxidoreductase n=1 Tax=Natronomonas sp. EA1 TaxID=3421655 RepID=UPI003EBE2D02
MALEYDFTDRVVMVTGAAGALGRAVAGAFADAGATVCGVDVVAPDDPLDGVDYETVDLTDEPAVAALFDTVVERYGWLDALCNIAGTWQGGTPIHETSLSEYERMFDVNLTTMFLASKHALPHLQETGGTIVSVSARASLEGGTGDGPYRAAKAGVRLLTETIAAENEDTVRANAVMPSVIDTPANREAMPDADHSKWVDPADIARVVMFLSSPESRATSGAAVPVYGEA